MTPEQLGLSVTPLRVSASDPISVHVHAFLHGQLHALLRYEPGTRSGRDPEDLHQMRVSVRRMRAVLKTAPGTVPNSDQLRAKLGWLGVLIGRLRSETEDFPAEERQAVEKLIAGLVSDRAKARRRLIAALNTARYQSLLRALAEATEAPLPEDPGPDLMHLVRRPYRRLRKAVKALSEEPPDEALHALRILGKRLRYASELAGPIAGKRAKKLLKATKEFQDVLGDHQDACVAEQEVRRLLAEQGEVVEWDLVFVAGRLVEREHVRRGTQRARWPQAWLAVERSAAPLL
jgi:CHAD domain-containing protein